MFRLWTGWIGSALGPEIQRPEISNLTPSSTGEFNAFRSRTSPSGSSVQYKLLLRSGMKKSARNVADWTKVCRSASIAATMVPDAVMILKAQYDSCAIPTNGSPAGVVRGVPAV